MVPKGRNIKHEKLLVTAAVLDHTYIHSLTVLVTKISGNHSVLKCAPATSETVPLKLMK